MAVRGCIVCVIRVLIRELIGVNITRNQADSKQMKKEATPSRTQSVTPRKLLQNTIANDPEPKEKQKPIKSRKKGRRMWPKMWPRSRGFWGRSNVNRCNGIWNERRIRCPTHASSRADSSSTSGALVQKEYMEAPVSGGKIANCKRQEKSFHVKKVKEVFYMSTSVYTKSFARR